MIPLCLTIILTAPPQTKPTPIPFDGLDAAAFRLHYNSLPDADKKFYFYLTTAAVPPADRQRLRQVGTVILGATSDQRIIERFTPQRLPVAGPDGIALSDLHAIDIRDLKWDVNALHRVLKRDNPYGGLVKVIRWDWLIVLLTDATQSTAQYELLYDDADVNRQKFLKFFRVNTERRELIALIEGASNVNVTKARVIKNHPVATRGYAYETLDATSPVGDFDPLERPDLRNFRFDASEIIVGKEVVSLSQGQSGVLQFYFLANAEGERQEQAPTDIATDHTEFRGRSHVTNSGSCHQCHSSGLNFPTLDAYRQSIKAGTVIQVKDRKQKEEIELIHRLHSQIIEADNKRYNRGVELTCGLTAEEFSAAFAQSIKAYDLPLTIADAARELGAEADELRSALGLFSEAFPDEMTHRLSQLAAEGTDESKALDVDLRIPRRNWERDISVAHAALRFWRSAKN